MTYSVFLLAVLMVSPAVAQAGGKIDQTEVSIADFEQFVVATRLVTEAEKSGGMVYEFG